LLIWNFQVIQSYPNGPSAEPTGPSLAVALLIGALVFWFPLPGHRGGTSRISPAMSSDTKAEARVVTYVLRVWSSVVFLVAGMEGLLLVYRVDGYFTTSDTFEYARVGEAGLASAAFWAGQRPFTVPLAFKASGLTTTVLREASVWFRVALFTQCQALLSLASFAFLALSAAYSMKVWWIRSISATALFAFGLTLDVSQWHKALLSESLSISLLNTVIGLWLAAVCLEGRWRSIPPTVRALLVGSLAGSTILYSFTRDAHAYFILSGALFLALGLVIRKIRTHPARRSYLLMTALMCAVPLFQSLSMRAGERWLFPFGNVLVRRILPDEQARHFFTSAGAPLEAVVSRSEIRECPEDECTNFHGYLRSQDGAPLLGWIRSKGQQTYLRYLLSNGVESVLAPLRSIRKLVGADSTEYRKRVLPDPAWFLRARQILFPRSTAIVNTLAVIMLVLMIAIPLRSSGRIHTVVPAFLIVSLYPLLFVVWHGDAVEVERHALQIAYQIRLAVWMALAFGLDFLCARHIERQDVGRDYA
jgi:hypothetical protein